MGGRVKLVQIISNVALQDQTLLFLENGSIQPTLDVLRRLAIALSVSADLLVFDKDERGPDDELKMEFEAISQFDAEEKAVVRTVLQGLIIQHQTKRWSAVS